MLYMCIVCMCCGCMCVSYVCVVCAYCVYVLWMYVCILYVCVLYMCIYVCVMCVLVRVYMACIWKRTTFQSERFPLRMGPGNQIQVIVLGGKHLQLWNHFILPFKIWTYFFNVFCVGSCARHGLKTTCSGQLSPSSIWAPGTELGHHQVWWQMLTPAESSFRSLPCSVADILFQLQEAE